jgi:hypothetical protein
MSGKFMTMRKLLLGLFFLLAAINFSQAQGEFVIACNNPNTLCCGFTNSDVANVGVIKFPSFVPPNNVGIVYQWYALHPKANKVWDTPVSARTVPIPWDGNYRVYVVVSFIDKATFRNVATYRSNTIMLEVKNCGNMSTAPN